VKRVSCVGLLLALVGGVGASPAASVAPTRPDADVPARVSAMRVVASVVQSEVNEGDRATVRVKVPKARTARRVTLQVRGDGSFGAPALVKVKTSKAAKTTVFTVTVTATNTAQYRALVSYKGVKKPVKSNVAKVTVWRWVPLGGFDAYFDTGGTSFSTVNLAGETYFPTWYGSGGLGAGAWEERFTLGRHCKAFKGVAGVGDDSDDGSSGTVTLAADDVAVWQSPVLTPGMTVPFEIALAAPYRFAVSAADTSPTYTDAHVAIGHPELLCTGVDPSM
jgi:hypothetical protein